MPRNGQRVGVEVGSGGAEDTARAIRRAFEPGTTTKRELARQFGTTSAVVYDVVKRGTWRHVD